MTDTIKTEYSNVPIGTPNPGCIVILVDQSWSMSEPFGDGTKADRATQAVNRVIEEIVLACRRGDTIRDRCHVSVIGYGEQIECVVEGMISDVASALVRVEKVKKRILDGAGGIIEAPVEMPVWLESKANNGTPMHEAFERAVRIVEDWISDKQDGFPPVVINITDGAATRPDLTANAARDLMNFRTDDGNVVVFNFHIANSGNKVALSHNTSQFAGESLAEFLFDISSALPQPFFKWAEEAGFSPEPGARCFGYNADEPLMIQLLQFGTLDVTQVRSLPLLPD